MTLTLQVIHNVMQSYRSKKVYKISGKLWYLHAHTNKMKLRLKKLSKPTA